MGAMTKGAGGLGLCWVLACGGSPVEPPPAAPPPPAESEGTTYSEDGLFAVRWVEGAGALRVTRWPERESGCRSDSYQLEVQNASAGAALELRYDRRALEARLLLGWARVDGPAPELLEAASLAGPGVIKVVPPSSARYCAVGPDPLVPVADPDSVVAPVGSGRVYALNQWRFAGPGEGLDGLSCGPDPSCSENSLAYLGPRMNDQLRQHVLGGGLLQLVELVGLDPAPGRDPQWVLKSYRAEDADDPLYPANNFRFSDGADRCCEFLLAAGSTQGGRARAVAGAVYDEGWATTTEDSTYALVLEVDVDPTIVTVGRVRWRFRLSPDLTQIEGRLSGVVPVAALAGAPVLRCAFTFNCGWAWSGTISWLDMVAARLQPDRDLDGDGLESVLDTDGDGHVDRCCDGPLAPGGGCRPDEEVPPWWPEDPGSCAIQPEMADGFSVTMAFAGVPAKIVGEAPGR